MKEVQVVLTNRMAVWVLYNIRCLAGTLRCDCASILGVLNTVCFHLGDLQKHISRKEKVEHYFQLVIKNENECKIQFVPLHCRDSASYQLELEARSQTFF